jgi:hypothetical protein
VIAGHGQSLRSYSWILAGLKRPDLAVPDIDADIHVIPLLAGHFTGSAFDTTFGIE